MTDRPPKLSPLALLVVWGARTLTLGEKVVWYHDWALDQGGADGSYISHESMEARLGGSLTGSTVSKVRQRLKRLTLHEPLRRRDARNLGWVSTLPHQCIPRTYREAPAMAAALDEYLAKMVAWSEQGTDERPPTRWTYFVQAGPGGPVKIGTAEDVQHRMRYLQTGHVHELELLGQTMAIREDQAHAKWEALRIRGEWFKATDELLAWIRELVGSKPGSNHGPPSQEPPVQRDVQRESNSPAAALGGRGETSALDSVRQAQLPSAFREKGVGASAPNFKKRDDPQAAAAFKASIERDVELGHLTQPQADRLLKVSGL